MGHLLGPELYWAWEPTPEASRIALDIMAAQKGLLPLPGEPARLPLGPSPGWGLYMGWDVALIRKVLVMSLKSQTDRDF